MSLALFSICLLKFSERPLNFTPTILLVSFTIFEVAFFPSNRKITIPANNRQCHNRLFKSSVKQSHPCFNLLEFSFLSAQSRCWPLLHTDCILVKFKPVIYQGTCDICNNILGHYHEADYLFCNNVQVGGTCHLHEWQDPEPGLQLHTASAGISFPGNYPLWVLSTVDSCQFVHSDMSAAPYAACCEVSCVLTLFCHSQL